MRSIAVGVVALLVGIVVGGLGPRSQVRALEDQLEKGGAAKCEGSSIGRQLASAFKGRPWEAREDETRDVPSNPPAEPGDEVEPPDHDIEIHFGAEGEPPPPEDIEENMEMMRDAMSLRQTQARAALDEEASPTEQQWGEIDAAIDDMNADLQELAGELVDAIGAGEEPSRREAMLFAADTLDVLIEADDRLYESLTPDQRDNMDEDAIDPFAHIDPGVVDIFMELDRQ